ncbi:hypothetical protein [Carnimonas bestiolae]|uniref:hypothetical protein n=1 Tax=Carnimonas bestiolae TaxID=3402172 RepID=UPI003EDB9B6A
MRELTVLEAADVKGAALSLSKGLADSVGGAIVGAMLTMDWGATIGGANGGNGGGMLGIGSIGAGVGMVAGGLYGLAVGGAIGAVTGLSGIDDGYFAALKALSNGSLLPDHKFFE